MDVYKQKLNIKDQVKYLEDKGISFNLFSKSNAEPSNQVWSTS